MTASSPRRHPPARRRAPDLTRWAALAFSALAAAAVLAMFASLLLESIPAWRHSGWGYLTGKVWFYRGELFGILPMVYGTVVVAAIALPLAGVLGIGGAIFSAELLPPKARFPFKVAVEILAGVPSVIYSILGLVLLRGWIYDLFTRLAPAGEGPISGDTLATGGVLLAVMILPTVTTLADDALRGVPAAQRGAARALGLTRAETVLSVSLPQAWPGLVAALLLGLGRALGETIAVFLVIGRMDNQLPAGLLDVSPLLEPGQTLTTKLGGSETFLAYGAPLHWAAISGLAVVLLVMVAAVTLAAVRLAGVRLGGPPEAPAALPGEAAGG